MKTFYQILQEENYPPEDQLGKKLIFIAKSPTGKIAIGLGNKILIAENEQEAFKETNRIELVYDLLDQTPEQLLSYVRYILNLTKDKHGGDENEKK